MFKIYQAEIKKTLARPGIYVLALFLAIILVLGAFIYNPTSQYPASTTLRGTTVQQKYVDFIGDDATDKTFGVKVGADAVLSNAISLINLYTVSGETKQETFQTLTSNLKNAIDDYAETYSLNSQTETNNKREILVQTIKDINSFIILGTTNSAKGSYGVIMTKENYTAYTDLYPDLLAWAEQSVTTSTVLNHIAYYQRTYAESYNLILNSFKFPTLSADFITKYTSTNFTTLQTKLNGILTNMQQLNQDAINDTNINNNSTILIDQYANDYVSEINTYANLIKYELICNAFDTISTQEGINALHLSTYSQVNSKTLLKKYSYLHENNKTEVDFAYPLTIGTTSNEEANGYDYAYFVMRLFSFVIIVYAVAQACLTIAGEIKDGTMRYMAIRPISRTKILFGKMLAIFVLSIILIIFGSAVSLVVGAKMYGLKSLDILTVFNGSKVMVIKPYINFLIYIMAQILELLVYLSIAMMLSCLIKSDLISLCLILLLYLVNILLPLFVSSANTWINFYLFSYVDFYALFGSSIYAPSSDIFSSLLGSKVYAGTNLILMSSVCIILIVLPLIIANHFFKKKEL